MTSLHRRERATFAPSAAMRKGSSLLLFVLFLAVFTSAVVCQTTEWTLDAQESFTPPILFPNETNPEGVAIGMNRNLMIVNGDGSPRLDIELASRIVTPVTVADLDEDGEVELALVLSEGDVVCLTPAGKEKWRRYLSNDVGDFKSVVAADVHPAKGLEVLIGLCDGWLYCFGADGRVLWRFCGDPFRVGPPAVGDVDADGAPEIVYSTDNGHVFCLTGHGEVKWRFEELAPYGRSAPNLSDLDGDGKAEILITRSNVNRHTCLIAVDHTGKVIWRTEDTAQGYASNATADLDGDGKPEVFHCDKSGTVYCENTGGVRRWSHTFDSRGIFWAPAIADLDGDGSFEIVTGLRIEDPAAPGLHVLGADGVPEGFQMLGGANAPPAIGDIDGDGALELVASMSLPNRLVCISWGAAGRVAWPSGRGNSRMTGADASVPAGTPGQAAKVRPEGQGQLEIERAYWGENHWALSWAEPAPEGAFVELNAETKDGRREVVIQEVKQNADSADLKCRLMSGGSIAVSARLMTNANPVPLLVATATAKPEKPDFCDSAKIEKSVEMATEAGDSAGVDTSLVKSSMLELAVERGAIQKLLAERGSEDAVAEAADSLRKRADDLVNMASALQKLWQSGDTGVFTLWQDRNPWDPFDPHAVPESIETWPVVEHQYAKGVNDPLPSDRPVRVTAYGNEFENVALTLLNTTGKTAYVRCSFQRPMREGWATPPMPPDIARNAILHRLLPVAAAWSPVVYDALPELDRSGVITLPPGEATQLWVTIKTHDLEPGTHRFTLYIGTLAEREHLTFREVPIDVEVWPVPLPTDVYQMFNWTNLDANSDQSLQTLIDHGCSGMYGPTLPNVPLDEHGHLAGTVDWTAFDAAMARVPKHWTLLWPSYPAPCYPDTVKVPSRNDGGYEAWIESNFFFQGVKTAIDEMAAHLDAMGFGCDQWAFYPMDEPWLGGFSRIPELRRFCELTKKANPNVRNYCDPTGIIRAEYAEEFKDIMDIWQPEVNVLKRDPELIEWCRNNARTFWYYEAPGPGKDLLPLGHYRMQPWTAWRLGTVGHGFWVYKMVDMWWARENGGYGAVYQNGKDVITTRRWEAERDGIEDWRALYVLRQEIEKARAAGRQAEADTAQALIDEAVEAMTGYQFRYIDEITRAIRDYEIDFDTLLKYRTRIAETTIALRQ